MAAGAEVRSVLGGLHPSTNCHFAAQERVPAEDEEDWVSLLPH